MRRAVLYLRVSTIDQMTAITLLTNEAALNAAKHVFSKGLGTRFDVSLSKDTAGRLNLLINDDGPGMAPQAVDANVKSLGMGLSWRLSPPSSAAP